MPSHATALRTTPVITVTSPIRQCKRPSPSVRLIRGPRRNRLHPTHPDCTGAPCFRTHLQGVFDADNFLRECVVPSATAIVRDVFSGSVAETVDIEQDGNECSRGGGLVRSVFGNSRNSPCDKGWGKLLPEGGFRLRLVPVEGVTD